MDHKEFIANAERDGTIAKGVSRALHAMTLVIGMYIQAGAERRILIFAQPIGKLVAALDLMGMVPDGWLPQFPRAEARGSSGQKKTGNLSMARPAIGMPHPHGIP